MKSEVKFNGGTAIVNGIELKRLGNAAFRDDHNMCVGDWIEDEGPNRIYLRSGDISEFRNTRELEPGIYACTVEMRSGSEHSVFGSAHHHYGRYSRYRSEPERMMYFHDTNGAVDIFNKLVSGEIPLKKWTQEECEEACVMNCKYSDLAP